MRTKLLLLLPLLMLSSCLSEKEEAVTMTESLSNDLTYYTEIFRPQFHFSTPTGNLADPNGLVYYDGEYHLFHQKNGTWAHAISNDLLHWTHMPIALEHDELGQALSGSIVVDQNDSTGLFNGEEGLVAIYTNTEGGEAQSIAYSKDKGRTWERYKGNPVIKNPGIKDFRDPKVFWHDETNQWIMVVSTDKSVTFYQSSDLIDWTYASRFGDGEGLHVAVWECPDLFRLPVDDEQENEKWVLHVSIGDNDETNGSTAQYFIGEFDGTTFINDNEPSEVLITDFGQDFYAAQTFSNTDRGQIIWLGWMANWRYPYQSPTKPWMGSMTIPRELSLVTNKNGDIRLKQKPLQTIKALTAKEKSFEPFRVNDQSSLPLEVSGTTFIYEATITWDQLTEFGLRLRHGDGTESLVGFDAAFDKVFLDRTNAGKETIVDRDGASFPFGQRYETDFKETRKKMKLTAIVDESSIELFINEGEIVFTSLIYTAPTNDGIEWYSEGGSIDVSESTFTYLHNTWRKQPEAGTFERLVTSVDEDRLNVGEQLKINTAHKPDYEDSSKETLIWESADPSIVTIRNTQHDYAVIEALDEGVTDIIVKNERHQIEKSIRIYVAK